MQVQSLYDIFVVVDGLYLYLSDKNIDFDEDGFPIFRSDMFLDEWPDMVVPFYRRNDKNVTNKKKTVICFFAKDCELYPRLSKLLSEIDEYKSFMGVIGFDLSITFDMDEEWQRIIALLNQLFLAVLAVNGVKIVFNSRSAGLSTNDIFKNVPQNIMVASGFLGCDCLKADHDFSYLGKIISILPQKLILYGKHDLIAENQLDTIGINYKVYMDYHRRSKEVRYGR